MPPKTGGGGTGGNGINGEGVMLNKLQLNDILKQQLSDVKISDIQLGRTGIFTLYAIDVQSFNRLLNDLTPILSNNGHPSAKIYVPRSIQRIKDTEKIAFVKRVDLEIPEDRITDALKQVGFDVINVIRLKGKDSNTPTKTIKITFADGQDRNTFVHTGLQVDCMHFTAEPASQNTKPVQCYLCLKYNHVAKYCKTKQQVCARCGDNHRMDQCTVASDAVKCYNCKGNHLATSNDCSYYREQEKRMLKLINQYSTSSNQVTTAPAIYNIEEFPPLPNIIQQQKEFLQNGLFDDILNAITSKMETIIKETTSRLFKSLQQKIKKIEKFIGNNKNKVEEDDALTISDSDSNEEESQVVNHIKNKQKQHTEAAKTSTPVINTSTKPTTTTTIPTTSKQQLGDLNATLHHMGSAKANARGRQLQELFKEGFIECVDDDTPTFEKNDYEVKLDWLLGSQPLLSFTSNLETHPPIGTSCGHKPLTFDISIGAEPKPPTPRMSFNFKAAKWAKFRSKLDQQLMLWNNDRRLDSTLAIEEYTSFITNSILVATQEAIPLSKQTNTTPIISEVTK
ncbi:unnamed protein product, partial [Rotaria sp. Silwood1]